MRTLNRLSLLLLLVSSLAAAEDNALTAIGATLDAFHAAADRGDKDAYLGLMTGNGVFLGTDEWERWPKQPDFTDYVSGRFQNGRGWSYRSVERNVDLTPDGTVAWFDEVVFSETNGRFRGTGVLLNTADGWKIAHYAMSFLILNENWEDVVALTRQTKAAKAAAAGEPD
ncbi:MAG: nuclear transport factor 2 family protein [Pseudomonadota bacterium]